MKAIKECCYGFFIFTITLSMLFVLSVKASAVQAAGSPLSVGERMYREGVLPNGKPMKTVSVEGAPERGSVYSCVGCHQRSGLGAYDEIRYPAVSGNRLFQPLYSGPEYTPAERARLNKYLQKPLVRNAYDDNSLANAIRNGRNADGVKLSTVMPRYELDDNEMLTLISYLKSLSRELSPGITPNTIRFATVIAGDVTVAERKELYGLMDSMVGFRNRQAKESAIRKKHASSVEEIDLYMRQISVARWELKGPPETWQRQLEAYYAKEPVFAILGGYSKSGWKPVHDFCETNRIPALFPVTDLPVVSKTDWYTFYFHKGLYLEGEAVAAYLAESQEMLKSGTILMLTDGSDSSLALSEGFEAVWKEQGQNPIIKHLIKSGEDLAAEELKRMISKEKPSAVIVLSGSGAIKVLETLEGIEGAPDKIFMSSTQVGKSFKSFPAKYRSHVYFSYPYKITALDRQNDPDYMAVKSWLYTQKVVIGDQRIATRLFPLMNVLSDGLMHMKRNYYRDHFLEVVSMSFSKKSVEYDKLSFGQDVRYASRNCYIVQLSPGKIPKMIKKKEWISN